MRRDLGYRRHLIAPALATLLAATALHSASAAPAPAAARKPIPVSVAELDAFDAGKTSAKLPNGQTIAYIDAGRRDGPPLLLVHGFTDNARDWLMVAPYLQDYRLIIVDLRGHGASSKPECCYTRLDFAYDLKLLMDHLGIDKTNIAGHSLGSMVTQTYAEYWPERTRKVVLISSSGGPKPDASPAEVAKRTESFDYRTPIRKLKAPIDPDSPFMVAWWASPPPVDETFLSRQRKDAAAIPVNVWLAVMDQGLVGNDLQATLPMLVAPTLLVWGDKDELVSHERKETLRAALPKAKVKVYPDFGHNPMWEDPADLAREMKAFLKD